MSIVIFCRILQGVLSPIKNIAFMLAESLNFGQSADYSNNSKTLFINHITSLNLVVKIHKTQELIAICKELML
jgi:hypothetical protein